MKSAPLDAIVIGAGAAGLAAARDLSRAGLRLAILEARDRTGGRILTLRGAKTALPVELGAEFIHGSAPETRALCAAGRLRVDRTVGAYLLSQNGSFHPALDFWGTVERFSRALGRRFSVPGAQDRSFQESVAASRLPDRDRELLLQFARGFQGADPRILSARSMAGEGSEASDDQFRIVSGYDGILEQLRAESDSARIELCLETIATDVRWKPGEVRVRTRSAAGEGDREFRARAVVVALPHAVLKAGDLRFTPAPGRAAAAIRRLEVGQAFKIVFRFREKFWDDAAFLRRRLDGRSHEKAPLGFVQAPGEEVPVWWTAAPQATPMLTGWAGGPDAIPLLGLDEKSRAERSLQCLSRTLALPRAHLDGRIERWWTYDWSQDPYSRGAYSYLKVGGTSAPATLAHPVGETLFFAGDYLDGRTMGTVEGALEGGRRAARKLLWSRS